MPERRALKRCEGSREELRRSLTQAEEAAEARRCAVETLRNEVAELKSAMTDRLTKAAFRKAAELKASERAAEPRRKGKNGPRGRYVKEG